MARIALCFSGYVRGVELETVIDLSMGTEIDVTKTDPQKIQAKLDAGEWAVSLVGLLGQNSKEEIELCDFEVSS